MDEAKKSDLLLGRWQKTKLLEGIESETKQRDTARLFQNQIELNEKNDFPPDFKRSSIPLLRRVFPVLNAAARSREFTESSKTTTMSVRLTHLQPSGGTFDLDHEAEQVARIAVELRDHIDRFIYGCPDEGSNFYVEGLSIDANRRLVLHYSVGV
jgi:hypothetical protein